jgi:hypothetical protein
MIMQMLRISKEMQQKHEKTFKKISFTGILNSCMIVGTGLWFQEECILTKNGFVSLYLCSINIFKSIPGTF